jgi:dTMP kinase
MSRKNSPGWLVVVEGIDGAGKSTVLRRLADHCAARGLTPVVSGEPTRGQWGMKLRESMTAGRLSLDEELALFIQDRAEHVATLIRPAMARGEVVLLDRYYFSTAAYQGARGANPAWVLAENEKFAPEPAHLPRVGAAVHSEGGRIAASGARVGGMSRGVRCTDRGLIHRAAVLSPRHAT